MTGGAGFIGSHVRRLLQEHGTPVRVFAHRADVDSDDTVRGDLADPASLDGICTGVTTLVHAASVINGSEEACRAINESGTAALVAEARRAGVRRIVYVSTAAVYGTGVHRGITEDEVEPAPVGPTSTSRLAAEHSVRAAGGTVLRPMFVYGAGDRWFLPTAAALAGQLAADPASGAARLSLISVHDLAEAVCAVAQSPTEELDGEVLHATHPEPTTLAEVLEVLAGESLVPARCDDAYGRAVADPGSAPSRRLTLLNTDHYYDSSRLWRAVDASCGPGFRATYPRYAQWYRDTIGTAAATC
ncbi:NAD-dependent epimerase/dehydratase family protein [Streptomyces sp. YGL11-2]|uniref:NAD-dependent epimerase/dehydratase family protein n=1 Tax=Streptomyces sp. YGL11-2 TaxID=3414028 RepID=UPI003CF4443D